MDRYIIVLALGYCNWIVLDEEEYKLFRYFQKKHNILNSLLKLRDINNIDEDNLLLVAKSLLRKIEESRFYKGLEMKKEEKMCNITKNIHTNITNNCNDNCKKCYLSAVLTIKKELECKN